MVSSHTDDTQQLHEMILISSLYLTRITLVHQQQGMTKEEILEGRDTHQQRLHFKQSNQSVSLTQTAHSFLKGSTENPSWFCSVCWEKVIVITLLLVACECSIMDFNPFDFECIFARIQVKVLISRQLFLLTICSLPCRWIRYVRYILICTFGTIFLSYCAEIRPYNEKYVIFFVFFYWRGLSFVEYEFFLFVTSHMWQGIARYASALSFAVTPNRFAVRLFFWEWRAHRTSSFFAKNSIVILADSTSRASKMRDL